VHYKVSLAVIGPERKCPVVEDIRFVLFVAAPVSLIVVPLLRAHRRARRVGEDAVSSTTAVDNLSTPSER